MRIRFSAILVAGLLILAAAGLASLRVPALAWRTRTLALKVAGRMPDLSWSDMFRLIRPGSGVWPENLPDVGNPHWAVTAPASSSDDLTAGERLFAERCAGCHASGGEGGTLDSGVFRYGTSDWALFRHLRFGIDELPAHDVRLEPEQAWQVIAYLRSRIAEGNPYTGADEGDTDALAVPPVTSASLTGAEAAGAQWLSHAGSVDGRRHSSLDRITPANVGRLRLQWMRQLPLTAPGMLTPLVVGGTMFVSLPDGTTFALDATSGRPLWSSGAKGTVPERALSVDGAGTGGPAVLDFSLFVPTIDGQLYALDTRTGKTRWHVRVADPADGYTIVAAPLVAGEAVVVGVAGTDRGVRGYLDAYAADDGRRLWRFYTVPGPGEPGHDTWGEGSTWRRGGGVTPVIGSYDPSTGLLFWGVGAPSPPLQGSGRPGDNLYTSSIVAIEASTGRLRWHYQLNPHDERDWGATFVPVLGDGGAGTERPVVYAAARNGFFYVIDRETGRMLRATPFARQTWNRGFDETGRPLEIEGRRPTPGGTLVYPGHAGAAGAASPAFDPALRQFLVLTNDGYGSILYKSERPDWPDGAVWGGRAGRVAGTPVRRELLAIDVDTGEIRWRTDFPGTMYTGPGRGGVLSTAGGVIFAADKERLMAVDSSSGVPLWHFDAGGAIDAAPVSYLGGGLQYVAVVADRTLLAFALDE